MAVTILLGVLVACTTAVISLALDAPHFWPGVIIGFLTSVALNLLIFIGRAPEDRR